jgi:hypothetical protein
MALFGVLASAFVAGSAQARERYFTYEPDSDSARYRSDEITLAVRQDLLGRRVEKLFRTRGKALTLGKPEGAFSGGQLGKLLKGEDVSGLQLYAVDVKDGEGFARGACKGADRAWVAFTAVKPDQDLHIYVLKRDPQTKAPELCETLAYRYRAEWQLPDGPSLARMEGEEDTGSPSGPH